MLLVGCFRNFEKRSSAKIAEIYIDAHPNSAMESLVCVIAFRHFACDICVQPNKDKRLCLPNKKLKRWSVMTSSCAGLGSHRLYFFANAKKDYCTDVFPF